MKCFSCVSRRAKKIKDYDDRMKPRAVYSSGSGKDKSFGDGSENVRSGGSFRSNAKGHDSGKCYGARRFTFKELSAATKNFRDMIGEGGFGKVYKGNIGSNRAVAIKQLNHEGLQGDDEFMVEIQMLCLLHHPNLVNLVGYCADGDQRLLVYEYMPKGSLEYHLFDLEPSSEPLSWRTRLKIAAGAAHGLQHLHCSANPPVIYRDLKSSNILLDNDFNPRLSDFGLAKLGPVGENTHVSTRVMGTYGYCAPEYAMSGKLTLKSDIYSFGVLLLELVSGRKAYDCKKKPGQQNLVAWARPFLRDNTKFVEMADPMLRGHFSARSLHHMVAVAAMCLHEQANLRPHIDEIVAALDYLLEKANKSEAKKLRLSAQMSLPSPKRDVKHDPVEDRAGHDASV